MNYLNIYIVITVLVGMKIFLTVSDSTHLLFLCMTYAKEVTKFRHFLVS
jgi:hypothetical protein